MQKGEKSKKKTGKSEKIGNKNTKKQKKGKSEAIKNTRNEVRPFFVLPLICDSCSTIAGRRGVGTESAGRDANN